MALNINIYLVSVDDPSEERFTGVAAHPAVVKMCHRSVPTHGTGDLRFA